jgi:DNA-binding IclR family transcriptional regulator
MRPTGVVERVADVLDLLSESSRPLGVTEVASELGVHKATASRLLATMASRGLVRRDHEGYRLGPRLARIAVDALTDLDVVEICRPVLRDLATASGEVAYMSLPLGRAVLYVEHVAPARNSEEPWVWLRGSPLHCSSSGKVFAAYGAVPDLEAALRPPLPRRASRTISDPDEFRALLPKVKMQGYATSVDELEEGMASVAVPVLAPDGAVLAAVGVAGPSERLSLGRLTTVAVSAKRAAAVLARRATPVLST